MLLNNIITIDDNPVTLNQKLARIEAKAIIEDFEKDFGFDLLALPNLDLPLNIYCDELVKIENKIKLAKQEQDKKVLTAWLDELENSDDCLQCIDNSVNHHCSCQY